MECNICFEFEFNITTKCNHLFCKNCYDKWFMMSNKCPMCRNCEYEIVDVLQIGDIDINNLEEVIIKDAILNNRSINEYEIQNTVNYICLVIDYYYDSVVLCLENAIKTSISTHDLKYLSDSLEEDVSYIKKIVKKYKYSENICETQNTPESL